VGEKQIKVTYIPEIARQTNAKRLPSSLAASHVRDDNVCGEEINEKACL
jgi:hypothetical protein